MKITTLLATPRSDAQLCRRFRAMGSAAFKAGAKREHRYDPNSMIGAFWCEGYDAAAEAANARPLQVADTSDPAGA